MAGNIYSEMFEGIAVPERLSPANIEKMLQEKAPERCKRAAITVSRPDSQPEKKTSTTITAIYRTVASLAACLVMAFGIYNAMGNQPELPKSQESSYAQSYEDLHKTFRKYYVDENKDTLDSALEEIEQSYNNGKQESDNVVVEAPVTTAPTTEAPVVTEPNLPDDPEVEIDDTEEPEVDPVETPELTQNSVDKWVQEAIISDGRIFIQNGNNVRVLSAIGGQLQVITEILPDETELITKKLEKFFVEGSRLVIVYSVSEHEATISVDEDSTVVGELISNIYEEEQAPIEEYCEISIYEFSPEGFIKLATNTQAGTLVKAEISDGAVYVITNYDSYKAPIIGVEDLQSYVPYYTINGMHCFVTPENILIPSNVATTDYTVVSGTHVASGQMSVQAVLGSEGKLAVTDSAVYVFVYGNKSTNINKLSLFGGNVGFSAAAFVPGVAINGGIFEDNGVLFVATLVEGDSGYTTSLNALNADMQPISHITFPTALTTLERHGRKIFLKNYEETYGADFSIPEVPMLILEDSVPETEGLVAFGNGYISLNKTNGSLALSTYVQTTQGLVEGFGTVIHLGDATSKALGNNELLFIDNYNGFVGVPYGFFDGFDYCYRFEMFKITEAGFVSLGFVEAHETDAAFEPERAVVENGILYLFSQGRIYGVAINEGTPAVISVCNLVESGYSGHTNW